MNNLPLRRSIRLQDYDYGQDGLYFITICCQNKICWFGRVEDEIMILSKVGLIAKQCWMNIPRHFPLVALHEFVVMPNHIHGILEITGSVGAKNLSPAGNSLFQSPSKTIGSVIRGFKVGVSKWVRNNIPAKDFSPLHQTNSIWQRNYYEHIIRGSESHQHISDYIENNPLNWVQDKYYNNQ